MNIKSKFKRNYLPLLLLQMISALILLISILFIKFISSGNFGLLGGLYEKYFEQETDVEAVKGPKTVSATLYYEPVNTFLESAQTSDPINAFAVPLNGEITSQFGYRADPFNGENKKHKGTDISGKHGEDILAAESGTVSLVDFDENGYGNYLTIAHSDTIKTLYAHCSDILVSEGEKIEKGQVIARVGSTGASTGNHLHFEIRIKNVPIDAQWYINFTE